MAVIFTPPIVSGIKTVLSQVSEYPVIVFPETVKHAGSVFRVWTSSSALRLIWSSVSFLFVMTVREPKISNKNRDSIPYNNADVTKPFFFIPCPSSIFNYTIDTREKQEKIEACL